MDRERQGYDLTHIQLFNKSNKQLGELDIEALRCSVCTYFLRDPYQLTGCGHRFCKTCLYEVVLKRIPRTCPEDGEAINDGDVRSDRGCSNEIKSLLAVCAGSKDGCTWKGGIEEAEDHVAICVYIAVACPQGCGQLVSRQEMDIHSSKCPNKPGDFLELVRQMSSLLLKMNQIELDNSKLQSSNSKLQSENSRLQQSIVQLQVKVSESNGEISNLKHQLEEISNLPEIVSNLSQEVVAANARMKALSNVRADSGVYRSSIGIDDGSRKEVDAGYSGSLPSMSSTSSSSYSSSVSSGRYSSASSGVSSAYSSSSSSGSENDVFVAVQKLQNEVAIMRPCVDEFSRLQSQLTGYMETVQTVQESVTRHAVAMEEIKLRQDILDVKTTSGIFIWKIPEITRRYSDAQQRRTLSLYSPPFHTSAHGYRICIRAYLNGDGSGKGTHISVFFVLMKSEHDNLLSWPFKSPVTFQLLNQGNSGANISETFMPDLASPSFQQPKSEMNIASGFPRFAKQSVLKDSTFTKGDAIFIRCKIDLSNIDRLE